MFGNRSAIVALVAADPSASQQEKDRILRCLAFDDADNHFPDDKPDEVVLSFVEAAKMLGLRNERSVQHLIRNGTLRGFYSGLKRKRATGVVASSIRQSLDMVKK